MIYARSATPIAALACCAVLVAGCRPDDRMVMMQDTVVGIVQVIFAIALIIGLIRVVMKFVQGTPDALGSLGWLVGGVLLWFGFQLFKDDLVSAVGGQRIAGRREPRPRRGHAAVACISHTRISASEVAVIRWPPTPVSRTASPSAPT